MDESWGIAFASNGDLLVATHQSPPLEFPDAHIYRMTPGGTVVWHKQWGGDWSELIYMAKVEDGVLYLGGSRYTGFWPSSADALLLALDVETGEELWSFTWDNASGYEEIDGIVIEPDGIYLSGWTQTPSTSNDAFVMKLTPEREIVWMETWGSERSDGANGHLEADADRLYIAAHYDADILGFGGAAALVAFDKATGAKVWDVFDDTPGFGMESGLGLALDSDRLYMVGMIPGEQQLGMQLALWAYDTDGVEIWKSTWGGNGDELSRAVAVDSRNNSLVVTGNTSTIGAGKSDFAFLRFDFEGELLETRTWGGPGDDVSHDFILDGDTGAVVGETQSFGEGKMDALVMRFQHRPWVLPRAEE